MFNKNINFGDLPEEINSEAKYFSKLFFGFIFSYLFVYAGLILFSSFITRLDFPKSAISFAMLVVSQLITPLTLVLFALFSPKEKSPGHPVMDSMNVSKFLKIIAIAMFILSVGSVVSNYMIEVVSILTGSVPENYVSTAVQELSIGEILVFVVILAPLFEELLFRRLLIDKLSKYGTSFSVCISAFVFGLIHGNLYQFFYAFGLGLLLGYVYCIFGKIRYPFFIHMFINFTGSVVPVTLKIGQTATITNPQMVYISIYMILVLTGGILFLKENKKISFYKVGGVLVSPVKLLYKSYGFIVCTGALLTDLIVNTLN